MLVRLKTLNPTKHKLVTWTQMTSGLRVWTKWENFFQSALTRRSKLLAFQVTNLVGSRLWNPTSSSFPEWDSWGEESATFLEDGDPSTDFSIGWKNRFMVALLTNWRTEEETKLLKVTVDAYPEWVTRNKSR